MLLNSVVLASADEHIWSNASEWAVDELKNAEIAGLIPESFNDKDLTNMYGIYSIPYRLQKISRICRLCKFGRFNSLK